MHWWQVSHAQSHIGRSFVVQIINSRGCQLTNFQTKNTIHTIAFQYQRNVTSIEKLEVETYLKAEKKYVIRFFCLIGKKALGLIAN